MPLMLPKSDGQKHQNQTQQYHDENRDLTHHQYKCIDHSYDCNNGQTADKLNSILWELEVYRLREQYRPHQLSLGRRKT